MGEPRQIDIRGVMQQHTNRTVWSAKKGVGTFLTLDVGGRHEEQKEDGSTVERGDLHFWVYLCDWTLRRNGATILASSSSNEGEYPEALGQLLGKELVTTDVEPSGRIRLEFDAGFVLELSPNPEEYKADDDLLLVYPWGQEAIGYRSDVGFYID